MKHYKSVEFCQRLECRAPPHKPKAPRKNAGDGSLRRLLHKRLFNLCFHDN